MDRASKNQTNKINLMKKLLTLIGLVVITTTTSAQQITTYYGTANTIGLETKFGSRLSIGLGLSAGLDGKQQGTDYTDVWGLNYLQDQELLNNTSYKNGSIYAIVGTELSGFTLLGRLGVGTQVEYTNYYDPQRILGNAGYYFLTNQNKTELLLGGSVGFRVNKLGLQLGYDTYNEATVGLSYNF